MSAARASSVRRYFAEGLGIDEERLVIAGYGEYKPVMSNASDYGRRRNRRIEIVLVRR